jgi:hypothetical protein
MDVTDQATISWDWAAPRIATVQLLDENAIYSLRNQRELDGIAP